MQFEPVLLTVRNHATGDVVCVAESNLLLHQPLGNVGCQREASRRELLPAGKPATEVVELLAAQLTNKLLHGPSAALRQAALDGDLDLLRAASRLYDDRDDAQPAP